MAGRRTGRGPAGTCGGGWPPRRVGTRAGAAYDDDDVNIAAIVENGLLIVIAFAFLGLLTGGFVKNNRIRVALLLGVGAIGIVI